jgi:hypothetical protein
MTIPPAPGRRRQITKQIHTELLSGKGANLVRAFYTDKREYGAIKDGPVYARWHPSGVFAKGKWNGTWIGTVIIESEACTNELDALQDLFVNLAALQLPVEEDPGAVLAAMRSAEWKTTPWEQLPFGLRGYKKARKRLKWTGPDGKTHHIYPDTLRKHVDPNCTCPYCASPPEEDE